MQARVVLWQGMSGSELEGETQAGVRATRETPVGVGKVRRESIKCTNYKFDGRESAYRDGTERSRAVHKFHGLITRRFSSQ